MERPRVLIVAESPFQLTLMADLLEANDIMTVREGSLDQAGRSLVTIAPTLVVVDVDLAHGTPDGLDRLRRAATKQSVPHLVVTEKGQRAVAEQVLADGDSFAVEKPIDTSAFPRKVVQEIRRRTTQTRPAQA